MKNIPEINHCIPNPRAYWRRFCKAHNTFEYDAEYHLCKACRGAWASAQRRKSPEELRQEALDHSFQPEYDNSTALTYGAKQFLSFEEVERLHEKYGESEDGEKREARIVLRVDEDS